MMQVERLVRAAYDVGTLDATDEAAVLLRGARLEAMADLDAHLDRRHTH